MLVVGYVCVQNKCQNVATIYYTEAKFCAHKDFYTQWMKNNGGVLLLSHPRLKATHSCPSQTFRRGASLRIPDHQQLTHPPPPPPPQCHIYASVNRVSIGSDNGLSPIRRQAIIWPNAGLWSIGTLGRNFSGILIAIHRFSFKRMHLETSSAKWRPFCPGGYDLTAFTLAVMFS